MKVFDLRKKKYVNREIKVNQAFRFHDSLKQHQQQHALCKNRMLDRDEC
jgi:hypothetical protein